MEMTQVPEFLAKFGLFWSALVGGLIASVVSPWVRWGIEKRSNKQAFRRDLVANWRTMIAHVATYLDNAEEGQGVRFFLERHPDYPSLKPHLSPNSLDAIASRQGIAMRPALAIGEDQGETHPALLLMTDDVARIERDWDLV